MSIEERVKEQFPGLFITLVSVMVGLVFADLIGEVRSRMALWPLNVESLRTWAQIGAMGTCTLATWVYYTHIGVLRRRVPTLTDSMIAFAVPIPLLIANSFVGRPDIWPWFYIASGYLVISFFTTIGLARMARAEHKSFVRLAEPTGNLIVFCIGAPAFGMVAWLDQHGWVSSWMEVFFAAVPIPSALAATYFFIRDWRRGVAEAE